MTDIHMPNPGEAAAYASFQLVQSLMRRLVESGAVPEAVVFGAVSDAAEQLESLLDEGTVAFPAEEAAGLIRAAFPTALKRKRPGT